MRRVWLCSILLLAGCRGRDHRIATPADPVITAISPNAGPRTGGNVVHILGSGFGAHPFVTFGARNVTDFAAASDSDLAVVVPADLIGPANVTVVTADGGIRSVLDAYYFMPLAPRSHDGRWFADAPDLAS